MESDSTRPGTCPICFEYYNYEKNKPMMGSCGHSQCKSCHDAQSGDRKHTCPICNAPKKFTNPTVNYAFLELVDHINQQAKQKEKEIPCGECKKPGVASRFRVCVICGISDGYLMQFAGKTHIAPSENNSENNFKKVVVQSFCDACEAIGRHKGHPTILVDELKRDFNEEGIQRLYKFHGKLKQMREEYNAQLDRYRTAYVNFFDNAFNKIENYSTMSSAEKGNMIKVLENVDSKLKRNINRLNHVSEHLEKRNSNLDKMNPPMELSDDSEDETCTYDKLPRFNDSFYHTRAPIFMNPAASSSRPIIGASGLRMHATLPFAAPIFTEPKAASGDRIQENVL